MKKNCKLFLLEIHNVVTKLVILKLIPNMENFENLFFNYSDVRKCLDFVEETR